MEPSNVPAIRFGLVARIGAIGVYLLLVFLQVAGGGAGGLLLIAGAGFAHGLLIGRWWAPAIGAGAALIWVGLAPGDGNTWVALAPGAGNTWVLGWYLLALLLPGAIAFGVLAARLHRADPGAAGTVVTAGAGLLAIALLGFAIFASSYNDDGPYPAMADWGYVAAVLLGPPGGGLFLAGLVAALPVRNPAGTSNPGRSARPEH